MSVDIQIALDLDRSQIDLSSVNGALEKVGFLCSLIFN